MKLFVVAIRDRAIDAFMTPFFAQSVGSANRMFADEVNRVDSNNALNKHPDDYDMFLLGSFDCDSGMFDTHIPKQIAIGKDVVVKSN